MRAAYFAILAAALFAGCTASGASGTNFELKPDRIGWYVGERAHFMLNITPSLLRSEPDYQIDRNFAIEEIQYGERGATFGGDYSTRNADELHMTLEQNGKSGDQFTLNRTQPGLDIYLDVPQKLRDSEYTLELKLFKAGWVKSDPFRVDDKKTSS